MQVSFMFALTESPISGCMGSVQLAGRAVSGVVMTMAGVEQLRANVGQGGTDKTEGASISMRAHACHLRGGLLTM